jgi:predicted nucleotidyltransferase
MSTINETTNIIVDKLQEISSISNFTLLFASEVSSRVHGYPSKDSDYDVKFIYIYSEQDYLVVNKHKLLDDRNYNVLTEIGMLSFTGYDITKFLSLLQKNNYSAIEWLKSPIIYYKDPFFIKSLGNINDYIVPYKLVKACQGIIYNEWKSIMLNQNIKPKKYLFIINTILKAREIIEEVDEGIIEFSHFHIKNKFYLLTNNSIRNALLELINIKYESQDVCISRNIILDEYIDSSIEFIHNVNFKDMDIRMIENDIESTHFDEIFRLNLKYNHISKYEKILPSNAYKINFDDGSYTIYLVVKRDDISEPKNTYMLVDLSDKYSLHHGSCYKSLFTIERKLKRMVNHKWINSYEPIELEFNIKEIN